MKIKCDIILTVATGVCSCFVVALALAVSLIWANDPVLRCILLIASCSLIILALADLYSRSRSPLKEDEPDAGKN